MNSAADGMRQQQLLQEMGIQTWQLRHSERLHGYTPAPLSLPTSCRLLLIAPTCPHGASAQLFSKVLSSMQLTLADALYLPPHELSRLPSLAVEWLWFAGCEPQAELEQTKLLHTPPLAQIDGHSENRRDLWRQICAHQ